MWRHPRNVILYQFYAGRFSSSQNYFEKAFLSAAGLQAEKRVGEIVQVTETADFGRLRRSFKRDGRCTRQLSGDRN